VTTTIRLTRHPETDTLKTVETRVLLSMMQNVFLLKNKNGPMTTSIFFIAAF